MILFINTKHYKQRVNHNDIMPASNQFMYEFKLTFGQRQCEYLLRDVYPIILFVK